MKGPLLVVDASQGIQAQTLANAYQALDHDLVLIPIVNKVDMVQAEPERVSGELQQVFGFDPEEIIFISAKDGSGVQDVLPGRDRPGAATPGTTGKASQALVFDSAYNPYKGIVAYVRVFEGAISGNERLLVMSTNKVTESVEIGIFSPHLIPVDRLTAGQVGYIATGLKEVRECTVGETITLFDRPCEKRLPSYAALKTHGVRRTLSYGGFGLSDFEKRSGEATTQ